MIRENQALKELNTFGLEANAGYYSEVTTVEELDGCVKWASNKGVSIFILGGGSNMLLTQDIDSLVIHLVDKQLEVTEETDESVLLKCGAGANWHHVVLHAIDEGWGGIENLSLIPGNIGAAPIQNIGAYGVELKDVFHSLEAYAISSGEVKTFHSGDCDFGYRSSYFKYAGKGKYIILNVTLQLQKQPEIHTEYGAIKDTLKEMGCTNPSIKDVSDAVISIRQSKLPDPAEIGNSGSFFKNPTIDKIDFEGLKAEFSSIPGYTSAAGVKVPAGWLIEQCGWKGHREGNIGVHDRQALVLVNHGGGSGSAIKDLALRIQKSVADKFGIELEPEVNII